MLEGEKLVTLTWDEKLTSTCVLLRVNGVCVGGWQGGVYVGGWAGGGLLLAHVVVVALSCSYNGGQHC